ncbi:MAG TPA: hypothetical protein VG456_25755 [Candidatus Sulfopaludibacter sp.]|jgi:hypothetical protein|nr:hypothetical protein [Candidatus Sulfopaludibacter sp.]
MSRPILIAGIAAAAGAAALFYAAPFQSTGSQPVTGMIPAGAQLCLEAKDLRAELAAWNGSGEKQRWLASRRYEGFSRSNLFFKLQRAWQELSDAAGFVPGWDVADSLAGRESALAIYNIGEVQFLYVTRLPAAAAMQSVLWRSRARYETRHAGGFEFFVRTSGKRTVAFAAARDCLILGSNEDYVAGALRLLSGERLPSVVDDPWYKDSASAAGRPGDLRLVMNLNELVKAPQFRSYWVQRNVAEVGLYSAAIADVTRDGGSFREDRVLLRKTPLTAPPTTGERLVRLAPDDVDFYRAWSEPQAGDVAALIQQKIFTTPAAAPINRDQAPEVDVDAPTAGADTDLETRIDLAPLEAPADRTAQLLRALLQSVKLTGAIQIQTTEPVADGVFMKTPTVIAVEAATAWPATTIPQVTVHGNLLLISNSDALLGEVTARLNARVGASNSTAVAVFRHAHARPGYQRLMSAVDRTAGFFSTDLVSLSEVFRDISVVEIRTQDQGARVRETVSYR